MAAASIRLGLQSAARDLCLEWPVELGADASAVIGICRRWEGEGKVRHLYTADPWVHDRLKTCDFALRKTPSSQNIADMTAKYLASPDGVKHIAAASIHVETGRADLAPTIAETSSPKTPRMLTKQRSDEAAGQDDQKKGSAEQPC